MKKYVVDRFEGEYAVLEDSENGKMVNVLKSELPIECKEGDFLEYDLEKYIILKEDNVKNNLKDRFNRLKK